MAKEYKVWIEIEEYDDETDHYDDLDAPFGPTATFATDEEALAFAERLHAIGQEIEPTDEEDEDDA